MCIFRGWEIRLSQFTAIINTPATKITNRNIFLLLRNKQVGLYHLFHLILKVHQRENNNGITGRIKSHGRSQ